ncbi:hypothetical protein [Bradyrhizobium denitrificans]|uniref:hypothetical protein n=1 Tax=Bradyrhizobium denitrificans TaxID=2734912 RepID=UPI001552B618|nr:hypothetical protein [Bradyrhizobium sp. LMG 8443]NPU23940.1 hypothetical protein [Bradyrhizobium sp. LMG 8443]
MAYHLVCVHPFHGYDKGQIVTDPAEVDALMAERDHHFVRIDAPEPAAPAQSPAKAPAEPSA